jgi:hypothetical protein
MTITPIRKTAVILFLGLSLCYLALAPGTTIGRGYLDEEMYSGTRMLQVINAFLKGRTIPTMIWFRHGALPVVLDLPLLKLGKVIGSPDFALSLEPIISTAAMLTILFLWLRKICSPGMSLLLTLTGAFGTMLWPYAYIGLETKQSLFLLLAGYFGLADGKITGWTRALNFAVACGLAIALKSTGIVLLPAIGYLIFAQFRRDRRNRLPKLAATLFVVGGIWLAGSITRHFYWDPRGGDIATMERWWIKSPLQLITNAIGVLGSPTKGLFLFAPILIAVLYAFPQAFRSRRCTAIFALLITACSAGFISLLIFPSDEVWGSRYMHLTIAPLLVCIGAAWPSYELRKHWPLLFLAAAGVVVSFVGAFAYYGERINVSHSARQNTMEWLTGDTAWNEVHFNGHLFHVWLEGGSSSVQWTPEHTWVWTEPPGSPTWRPVDLRDFAHPQSLLLESWNVPLGGFSKILLRILFCSLILGPLLLIWVILQTAKER